MIRTFLEALGIFIVTALIPTLVYAFGGSSKAYAMVYWNNKGLVLMLVGGFYLVFGLLIYRWRL